MHPIKRFLLIAAHLLAAGSYGQDPDFHLFLCLGQSNMEGFPGIPKEDQENVDPRFQVLAAVDFPQLGREQGQWYPAIPPLCRPDSGLSPADYFGRTMVARLPGHARVGVITVAVAGARIELFDEATREAYVAAAPEWMTAILAAYGENPYQHLVDLARRAQAEGVIRGILLHQGESNVNDQDWPAKVKAIYGNLLQDLNLDAAEVPLLAGEVVSADQQGAAASMNTLIAELPRIIPTAHVVSSAGCASRPDRLHFSPEGYRELGRRYAETMLPLLATPPAGTAARPAGQRQSGPSTD